MRDIIIALFAAVIALVIVTYEIAALTLPGWHTISWFAHEHIWLRVALTAAIFALVPLFWYHASQNIPR